MFSEDKKNLVIFNGAIYNFKEIKAYLEKKNIVFNTDSDTEVIANSYMYWGEKMFNYLDGMWAISIYDERKNQIILSRDYVGQKPLFYLKRDDCIYFSSQMKGFTIDKENKFELDKNNLKKFLVLSYLPAPHTLYKNIHQVEPGENITINLKSLEIKKRKPFPNDENFYPGDYIIDIANKIIKENKIKDFNNFKKIYKSLSNESLNYSMQLIKNNLSLLGIKHNNFVYESNLINNNIVSKIVKKLEKKNYIYKGKLKEPKGELTKDWKIRNQLLFKSTLFGDDSDRPLQKADGTWTYFAGDLGYHSHKISRKFDVLINILGADHAGYIKRIVSATKAISNNKINLLCKVSQLVKLFKNGQPFKMSKRRGDYITVEDLVNEIGRDSVRFMMLSRSNDVELDFDFKQVADKSKDNPVFYVQYAYARINSIFRLLNLNLNKKIKIQNKEFSLNNHEIEIMKKISEWPKCLYISTNKLEPHRITFYLYELATLFHAYWNLGKENKEFRFIPENKNLNYSRLVLLQALGIVIKNAMSILGVSTPKSM